MATYIISDYRKFVAERKVVVVGFPVVIMTMKIMNSTAKQRVLQLQPIYILYGSHHTNKRRENENKTIKRPFI